MSVSVNFSNHYDKEKVKFLYWPIILTWQMLPLKHWQLQIHDYHSSKKMLQLLKLQIAVGALGMIPVEHTALMKTQSLLYPSAIEIISDNNSPSTMLTQTVNSWFGPCWLMWSSQLFTIRLAFFNPIHQHSDISKWGSF